MDGTEDDKTKNQANQNTQLSDIHSQAAQSSSVVYRCPVHALPYGSGHSCPRCAALAEPKRAEVPVVGPIVDAFFRLPRRAMNIVALAAVAVLLVLIFKWSSDDPIVGGDTRFGPSLECRQSCAKSSEKTAMRCADDLCRQRAMSNFGACENECDLSSPRTRSPYDFSYSRGETPEWMLVWAALAGNTEFVTCFEKMPGPATLRLQANATGMVKYLDMGTTLNINSEVKQGCLTMAGRDQVLPTAGQDYVFVVSGLDFSTVKFPDALTRLQQSLAQAVQDEDVLAAAKISEAMERVKRADAARTEREEARRKAEEEQKLEAEIRARNAAPVFRPTGWAEHSRSSERPNSERERREQLDLKRRELELEAQTERIRHERLGRRLQTLEYQIYNAQRGQQ